MFGNTWNNDGIRIKSLNLATEFYALAINVKRIPQPNFISVKWNAPPEGWIKINTDGSSIGNPGKAGCGSILRNDQGIFIAACYRILALQPIWWLSYGP